MAAAAAAASAAAAPAAAAARRADCQDRMNALRSTTLRRSTLRWDAAAAFFAPPFRSRHCRRRVPSPAAALPVKSHAGARARAKLLADAEPRDPWLASLSLLPADDSAATAAPTGWAIGIDPDTAGAISVLSPDGSSQVFDNPCVHIVVSEVIRKRLDTKSIIQLLRGLDAPPGTLAYIEKSSPFPTDGKLGWWSTGFSYGLWIAALVASEFSVVPVASQTWKAYFGLTRRGSPKDDSRQAATILFPDKALSLNKKKHHGRAEALLLAAYGKGLVLPSGTFSKT